MEKVTTNSGFERGVCFVQQRDGRAVQMGTHNRAALQRRRNTQVLSSERLDELGNRLEEDPHTDLEGPCRPG